MRVNVLRVLRVLRVRRVRGVRRVRRVRRMRGMRRVRRVPLYHGHGLPVRPSARRELPSERGELRRRRALAPLAGGPRHAHAHAHAHAGASLAPPGAAVHLLRCDEVRQHYLPLLQSVWATRIRPASGR